ncbi:hypothetical protein D3C72_1405780 [compost metagenome]
MEMTSSSPCRRMPRTPVESRPLNTRTSSALNRMARPSRVVSRMSSSALQMATPTMRSPSSSFMAILPARFTVAKSLSLLRRTSPDLVANMMS